MKQDKAQPITVRVKKGQRLSEVKQLFPLPSNGIFHKRLPGLGATYGEIVAPRDSIIVLPNRPVIETKVAKHNAANPPEKQILGIYKGITKEVVEEYLMNEKITYKKILTTPEGYQGKFRVVVADIFDHIKKEYYLLIDECERSIQDVDYRQKITAPFDDLFDFVNKGLISATTLPFSDPRLSDFTNYIIAPQYTFTKPLTLIGTNNLVSAFREYALTAKDEPQFIFLSSISAIIAITEATGIKGQSKIHCSESRVTNLKMKKFNADHRLDVNSLAKYNFFTSRFYSALDIELDFKPNVLMLTEVVFAEHSILDPQTEVIQIAGRFRNGTKSITHITNFNSDITTKTPEQIRSYLDGQQEVYREILLLKDRFKSESAQEAIEQILSESKFARYFKRDGSYNWFMLDNYIQEERVLELYRSTSNLLSAYGHVEDHFKVTVRDKQYPLSDKDRLKRQSAQSRKEEIKEVVEQLTRLEQRMNNFVIGGDELRAELTTQYPNVAEAFTVIKRDAIIEAGYNETTMKRKVTQAKHRAQFFTPEVIKAIHEKFRPGQQYTKLYVTSTLQDIYDRNDIKEVAYGPHILRYFDGVETTRGRSSNKVYVLLGIKKLSDD